MSIMTQLEFELDFTTTEKELARYILSNGESILNMSIQDLAKTTYSSPATIVRLTKKLGLNGFGDFKIKYSAELQANHKLENRIDVNYPFTKNDSFNQIGQNIASLNNEVIEDTLSLINFKELEKIIDLLIKAKRIFIFGNGNSILAAMDFQHKMMRINKLVEVRQTQGEQIFLTYNATKDDVAIIISYSGETTEQVEFARILKEHKVPIVGITSLGENQLSKYCNHILNTGSREKVFNKIAPFSSKMSMEYILNLIYSCIFKLDYDNYMNTKLNNEKQFDHRHPNKSPINED